MTTFVALLRAVNVGGTGKLPMSKLREICETAGFSNPRTYIASGNVVFASNLSEVAVKAKLEKALTAYAGKPIAMVVRTGKELTSVLAANPFKSTAANRTVAIFLDAPPPKDVMAGVTGKLNEEIAAGSREIYVHYSDGIGISKLKIPAAKAGTARNMQTIAKLAELAAQ